MCNTELIKIESRLPWRIFESKRDELTRGRRELSNEFQNISSQITRGKMGGTYSRNEWYGKLYTILVFKTKNASES